MATAKQAAQTIHMPSGNPLCGEDENQLVAIERDDHGHLNFVPGSVTCPRCIALMEDEAGEPPF